MADLILFKVKFIGDGWDGCDHVHVVARGYDHAEQLAIEYMRSMPQPDERRDIIDGSFILSIRRLSDSSEFGGLIVGGAAGIAQLRPVS